MSVTDILNIMLGVTFCIVIIGITGAVIIGILRKTP